MGEFLQQIALHWNGGGKGMYPIALCLVFAVAVMANRIYVLFFQAAIDKDQFVRGLKTHIFNGDLDKAISYTAGQNRSALVQALVIAAGV